MGNLKLNILDVFKKPIEAKKLDPSDPYVKELIQNTIKQQEAILRLKHVSAESLRQEITI